MSALYLSFFFFFNDTATTEIYTLSLHDALPICAGFIGGIAAGFIAGYGVAFMAAHIRLPQALKGLLPMLILPVLGSLFTGLLMFYLVGAPVAELLQWLSAWLRGRSEERRVGKEGRSRWSPYH